MKTKMEKLIPLLLLLITTGTMQAQDDLKFTLAEAQEYALKHSYVVQNSGLDVESARKKVWETIATGLPQVSGDANYTKFIDLPVSLIPGEFFGEEEGTYVPVKFGQDYNSDFGFTVDQLIFDGSWIVGIGSAKIYLQMADQNKEKTKIEVKHAVAQSYFMVLAAEENLKVMRENLANSQKLEKDTKAMYENGFVEEQDVDQMRLLVQRAENEILKVEREIRVARMVLKYTMGIPVEERIELTQPLDEFVDPLLARNEFKGGFDYSSHIDYRILDTQRQLSMKELKLEQSAYLPRITGFYNWTKTAYGNSANLFKSSVPWFKSSIPEIVVPMIFVQTIYPGNSPVDIENLITRPIEQELKGMDGVKKISSASYQDISTIIVEFDTDVEVKQALQDTKDNVDKAHSELPGDLEDDPLVLDLDFSEFPIMNVNISGDFSMRDLKVYAEILQDEFEGLSEISEAEIRGIDDREIQINVDPYKLEARGMTYEDIAEALRMENVTIGAGDFTADNTRRVVRTEAEYTNMDQIRRTIIKLNEGKPVYIRDVADVVDGYKEKSTISRLDNKPVVSLAVTKKSGANILEATEKVNQILKEQVEEGILPQNLEIVVTDDMSTYVKNDIANLENSIIMGMLLVIFVLFLFLGFRNALFSGLAIPMSMFLSFIILNSSGITLNSMVLYGLILALGMLVDNAIVVVENVYRLLGQGYSLLSATKKGVSEIAFPIISSTLTTLAAFTPLLFWEGIVGEFMGILPQTLIIVLASSLFVALVLNPPFIATFMKIDNIMDRDNWKKTLKIAGILTGIAIVFYVSGIYLIGNILATIAILMTLNIIAFRPLARWFQARFLVWLENFYERQLRNALTGWKPVMYFGGTFVLLIVSINFYGIRQPSVVFFPDTDPQTIFVTMELPLGTSIDRTDEVSRQVEEIVDRTIEPYKSIVKSVTTSVGTGKAEMFDNPESANKSLTSISFVEYKLRDDINTSKIMQELSENLEGFVGAKIYVEKEDNGPPVGAPINIEVTGQDFAKLIEITDDFMNMINEDHIPGIDELKLDINVHQPEMLVRVDRERARRYELSTQEVAWALRNSLYGYDVGDYKEGEDKYDIFIRLKESYRNNVSTLMNQKLLVEGNKIPISAVADFEYSSTYDKINRIDHKRVLTVSSNVVEGYNANVINDRIRQVLADYDMPNGYDYAFTGEQQEQDESSDFLIFALLVAIALIGLILVTQFNSFIRPTIILITVLFSTIGVFLGLAIFKMEFVIIMTGIGIISLAGIVVNNGIVLIDYIDLTRKRKRAELGYSEGAFLPVKDEIDCLVLAGKTRLRPVLLTAITTVLGLVPLAVGLNFDFFSLYTHFDPDFSIGNESVAFWGPMSWTVIFGLTFATFLTLLIAPVMYILTIRTNYRIKKLLGILPEENQPKTVE